MDRTTGGDTPAPDGPLPASTFADLLRRLRLAAGLTQEALAERAGLSPDAIGTLERGVRLAPHRHTVDVLATALRLSATEREWLTAAARRPRAPRAAAPAESRLPVPRTRLIDRAAEVASCRTLLRSGEVRLLTLTGAPGVGKSRLAIEVAAGLTADFPDGIAFVELASLADPDLAAPAVARALGVDDPRRRPPLEAAALRVGGRRVLLVLDGFEHLLPAAGELAELLGRCGRLSALLTSRARLRVRGERQVVVLPLPVPAASPAPARSALRRVPSVALFLERARAVSPAFRLTRASAPAVAEICRRLDGLPLALELVAAWTRLLEPEALLARLDQRLPMLEEGTRDAPERQRSMRLALEWSCAALPQAERTLFRRLAAFASGAALDAVEAVCSAAGSLDGGVLHLLAELVDRSLVVPASGRGPPRVRLLQTVGEYAGELLRASGEAEATARAHAHHYAGLAALAAPHLDQPEQAAWLDRLQPERDNLRTALRWARGADPALGLRLAADLWQYWAIRGPAHEGRVWLEAFLQADVTDPALRVRALNGAAALAWHLGHTAAAGERAEEALRLSATTGDRRGCADALNNLAAAAFRQGDLPRAAELCDASLETRRRLGHRRSIAISLADRGLIAFEMGDPELARRLMLEALDIQRGERNRQATAGILGNLGGMARLTGRREEAEGWLRESLALSRALADVARQAQVLHSLGDLHRTHGDLARAAASYGESLGIRLRLGHHPGAANCLHGLAALALARGDAEEAARLRGAAAGLLELTDVRPLPSERAEQERTDAAICEALGEPRFRAAWADGRALPQEELVAIAASEERRPAAVAHRGRRAGGARRPRDG